MIDQQCKCAAFPAFARPREELRAAPRNSIGSAADVAAQMLVMRHRRKRPVCVRFSQCIEAVACDKLRVCQKLPCVAGAAVCG